MVSEIVMSVLSDNTNRRITIQEAVAQTEEKAKKEPKKRERKASAPKEKKPKTESKERVNRLLSLHRLLLLLLLHLTILMLWSVSLVRFVAKALSLKERRLTMFGMEEWMYVSEEL